MRIVFDDLPAISFDGGVCKMHDGIIGAAGSIQSPGVLGARFLIDSEVPVTIDFTGLAGIGTTTDLDFAGIYVRSDDVVLENLVNLQAGAAGVAVEGQNVTIRNVGFDDSTTSIAEMGVALLNGATDVTIEDSRFSSQFFGSIVIDGSADPAQQVSISNLVIDSVSSRGVESHAHVLVGANAVVDGLTVTGSAFGATDESFASHAFWASPGLTVTDLAYSGNTVLRGTGAEQNVFYFEPGTASTFTDTVIDGNLFKGVSEAAPLSNVIGYNQATWNGLRYTGNTAEFTRSVILDGEVTDALLDGNTFTSTRGPSYAAVSLGSQLDRVTVSNNLFDMVWALDAVRIQGSSAQDVLIENNRFHDFHADVSRSAVAIIAPGSGNVVRGNEFVQHLDRAGVDLPATLANHWAVFVWAEASAVSAADPVGWSILDNSIDGFGGDPAIASQAPIVHNAIGKLPVTGNTFGENTRGSFDTETEDGALWFLWNVHNAVSNNTVQTFRAESVVYDGDAASFVAEQPVPLPGNAAATSPVTLHVYWTADDHAEEYLGAIEDVTPGQRVSIPTEHTTGYVRVQTVDLHGFTSQYSSIDQDVRVAPAPPTVTETTEDGVRGTAEPGAVVTVRDPEDEAVATVTADDDGRWAVAASELACASNHTVTQTVGDLESDPTAFTTAECHEPATPAAPVVTVVTEDWVAGTGEPGATVTVRDGDGAVVLTATVDGKGA